jgi:protein O-GlcNAc transferase
VPSRPVSDPRYLKARRALEEAVSYQQQGLLAQAEKSYARAIAKTPDYFDALHFYGLFKYQQGKFSDALKLIAKATKINPRSANAFNSLGTVFGASGRHVDALASFDSALALDQNHISALSNRGNSLNALRRFQETIISCDRALSINPNYLEAYIPRGAALLECNRHVEGLESYQRAIRLNPNYEMGWMGGGNALFKLRRHDEAIGAYDKALALKPDLAGAWLGRGNVLFEFKRYDEALACYDKARALKPDLTGIEGLCFYAKMLVCNWSNFDTEIEHLTSSIRNDKTSCDPFTFIAVSSSPEDQLRCAKLWATPKSRASQNAVWRGERYQHDRIRVAYVSADFRQHAVSFLAAGMFEHHDKSRFEITAISIGPDDNSEIRQRLKGSFEHFIDATTLSDGEIALRINEAEIDLLIDLQGFTTGERLNIFAQRPAPVQVNYLGYPGTTGASYIDYIIADPTIIRDEDRKFYSEKIAVLPNSYQANDRKRIISNKVFNRSDAGLPSQGFVFCCFNNNYKINPLMFDCWMRLLDQVEGSVLWLLADNASATSNLRRHAVERGANPERLIFASRLPLAEHLARHRLADLFLDTSPFNAHTTASDALWAGLPVLTCVGKTFAGRVASSLLNAIGMPELITGTMENYEQMAIDLATNPEQLALVKRKLTENRLSAALFDTALFTKHIEAAYAAMHERHLAGLPPEHIAVAG